MAGTSPAMTGTETRRLQPVALGPRFRSVIPGRRVSAGPGIQKQTPARYLDSGFARLRSRPGMTGEPCPRLAARACPHVGEDGDEWGKGSGRTSHSAHSRKTSSCPRLSRHPRLKALQHQRRGWPEQVRPWRWNVHLLTIASLLRTFPLRFHSRVHRN